MKKIIIASNNQGKIQEFQKRFESYGLSCCSLNDLECEIEVIEDGLTLYDNARKKALAIAKIYPQSIVIADDTGLFVDALGGEPGVRSARYALDHDSNLTISEFLLKKLTSSNRSAYFQTVLFSYLPQDINIVSIGTLLGNISHTLHEGNGFGYDNVFLTLNGKYLSELTVGEKNLISHRGKALEILFTNDNFKRYLKSY